MSQATSPRDGASEHTPLLSDRGGDGSGSPTLARFRSRELDETQAHSGLPVPSVSSKSKHQWKKNLVLLLGCAILLAIFRHVASEFGALESASWILNSYIIGVIVAQPLYGKLSDIFGRKPLLLFAYSCYCVGGLVVGSGFAFWGVLLGRVVTGIGNAGITVIISTLIVELVPFQEVALWRSYVYTVNQVGRAAGPSLGGFITDGSDWRLALLFQVPINVLSAIFIWWKMSFPAPIDASDGGHVETTSGRPKWQRIDFPGAISIGIANTLLLLLLDEVQREPDVLHDPRALVTGGGWIAFIAIFIATESTWAREPIFPLRLMIRRSIFSSYSIQFLQTAAQMALYTSIPFYFRITRADSYTVIAFRLLVITLGTILGGLISGIYIQRTGLYRRVTWLFLLLSNLGFLTIFLRWRGAIGWLETLYGFPVGLGFGVSLSSTFIGLTERVRSQVAVATSGFYLFLNLGSLFGVGMSSLLIQSSAKKDLLDHFKDEKVVQAITSDMEYAITLPPKEWQSVIDIYTRSLVNVWLFALICGCLALLASLSMHEGAKDRKREANDQGE